MMETNCFNSTLRDMSFSSHMPQGIPSGGGYSFEDAVGPQKSDLPYCDFLLPEPLVSDSLSNESCFFRKSHEGIQSTLDQADQVLTSAQENEGDVLYKLGAEHQLLDFEDCCSSQWYSSNATETCSRVWSHSPSVSSEDDIQSIFGEDAVDGLCGHVFNACPLQQEFSVPEHDLSPMGAPSTLPKVVSLPPLNVQAASTSALDGFHHARLFSDCDSASPLSVCSMGASFFHDVDLNPSVPSVTTSQHAGAVCPEATPSGSAETKGASGVKRSSSSVLGSNKKQRSLSPAACPTNASVQDGGSSDEESPAGEGNGTGYRFWSLAETRALVEGVRKCGGGKWAEIKKLSFAAIEKRSAVDLKDKWRNLTRIAKLPPALVKQDKKREATCPPELLQLVRELAKLEEAKKQARAQGRAGFGRSLANRRGRPAA
mmetsp:Transcript_4242/g.11966  ORF Transcript_4242/g.11966 Transcript_4242/m.11966 type:complete len:429 (+) Transcript_4242:670-1956(+)